ncbi:MULTISPECIES: metalloregulator ArsR/SmtB family transcription factor [Pseudoalteromonas]|uniref:metalloregulator ArsR/SmtB family transcription factor n=1 Tax=Pseudoalteromonas TaxID=53246 RepID=UPI001E622D15|nr:metalloregulator ArsR/SmtB family transcription factor [Pseudoalteromonas rubra]MCG7560250.1 metalloregulator ArsR/SmtB family transcription factor [Pseudoalteromonas sp. McH1-42]
MKSIYLKGENPDLIWLVGALLKHHNPDVLLGNTMTTQQISFGAKQALSEFGLSRNLSFSQNDVNEEECDIMLHLTQGACSEQEGKQTPQTLFWQLALEDVDASFNPYRKALYELNCKVRNLLAEPQQIEPITPMAFYKAMSDELRLKTLLLILQEQELCVCELMVALDEPSQPKVSRHLAQLRKAGILTIRKQSQWVYYALNSELPGWMQQVLQRTLLGEPASIEMELARLDLMGDRPARQQSCCA